jgi:hypothetical protein
MKSAQTFLLLQLVIVGTFYSSFTSVFKSIKVSYYKYVDAPFGLGCRCLGGPWFRSCPQTRKSLDATQCCVEQANEQ